MTERSHPPALLRRTARTLREETPLSRGDGVLVAVSGGGDSMALLHVLARLAPELGIQLWAHGVDHGLRPEAAAELDLAEQLARELGVPFSRSLLGISDGGNLQARAREARYAALDAEAALVGARWDEAALAKAEAALTSDFRPLTDMRASAAYRMQVAQNLLRRFWLETRSDAPLAAAATSVWAMPIPADAIGAAP